MKYMWIVTLLLLFLFPACDKDSQPEDDTQVQTFEPVAVNKTNPMKIWVHYMPWFEDRNSSDNGQWGSHWTMATKNPDNIDENGKREIAAHFYPLIGPYASNDPTVLEYHFLLMKYAGVDGILIDWYGTRAINDYPANLRNSEAIVEVLEKVGLDFAIVYEDRTLEQGLQSEAHQISQAMSDMDYLQKNFFSKENYIRINNHPLLLNFGPIVIKEPAAWNTIFSRLNPAPAFFPLYGHGSLVNNHEYTPATGEYIWVDATPMETKYAQKNKYQKFIGGAYPGFKDFYPEGGWGANALPDIDHAGGNLFRDLLTMAKEQDMDYLQLITWNDFGEGTMIEPTEEFQYTFLEILQTFTGVSYTKSQLESILNYYTLYKEHEKKTEVKKQLQQAFYYFISLQDQKADELLNQIK